jgi:hypothetical protein
VLGESAHYQIRQQDDAANQYRGYGAEPEHGHRTFKRHVYHVYFSMFVDTDLLLTGDAGFY